MADQNELPPVPPNDEAADLDPAMMLELGLGTNPPASAAGNQVTSPLPPGPAIEELAGELPNYDILEMIGRGGMGTVYKARQHNLDRIVALKVVSGEVSKHPMFEERFKREARAMARLSHPSIVAVHEFGQTAKGQPYIAMEFVEGSNLRQVLRAGRMKPAEALKIIPPICDALQYAHDEGIVHRDIKPENILLDMKGRVKIADFGLAKLFGPAAQSHGLTDSNAAMGTPHYMAPEQFERPLEVDHRADVYALGVMLYEMLTGELPIGRFAAPSQKVEVDVRMDDVVLRALERDPEQRYQHVSEMRSGIESASLPPLPENSRAVPSTPPPPPAPEAAKSTRYSRWVIAGIINQVVAVALGFLWIILVGVLTRGSGAVSWVGASLPVFFMGFLGAAFHLKGLLEIRGGGGRIRGAMAAAIGIVAFPALILWGIFGALARALTGVLDALLQYGSLGVALRNPTMSVADRYGIVYVLGGLVIASVIAFFSALSLRRYATPWIAWAPAQRKWVGVLLVATMLTCIALALSSASNIDDFRRAASGDFVSTLFRMGAIDPWIRMTEHANSSTTWRGWEMNLISVSGLLLLVAVMCDILHAWFQRNKENGARRVRTGRIFAMVLIFIMSVAAIVNFTSVKAGSRWNAMSNPPEPGTLIEKTGSKTAYMWSGPPQYPCEFVLIASPGATPVTLDNWDVKPAQNGQGPGWGTGLTYDYQSPQGPATVAILYEGYSKDKYGPTDIYNVTQSYSPTGDPKQKVEMNSGVRYKGKELTIFDDERGRLIIKPTE